MMHVGSLRTTACVRRDALRRCSPCIVNIGINSTLKSHVHLHGRKHVQISMYRGFRHRRGIDVDLNLYSARGCGGYDSRRYLHKDIIHGDEINRSKDTLLRDGGVSQEYGEVGASTDGRSTPTPLQIRASFASSTKTPKRTARARLTAWRKLLFFVICTTSPFVLASWGIASLITEKEKEDDMAEEAEATVEKYINAAEQLIKGGCLCFCIIDDVADDELEAVPVDPHPPERRLLRLPSPDILGDVKGNALTDAILATKSSFALPLNFIHFAVHRKSPLARSLSSQNGASLLYVDNETGSSVLLRGIGVTVEDLEYRRHYWRNEWSENLPGPNSPDYVLVKFVPNSVELRFGCRRWNNWNAQQAKRVLKRGDILWEFSVTS